MIPKNINRVHVLNAIRKIDRDGVPKSRKSRKFQLFYNGKYYPAKYVVSLANKYANGRELDPSEFSGGQEVNNFLRKLGFEIVNVSSSKKLRKPQRLVKRWKTAFSKISFKHSERCPKCKETIRVLLKRIYGAVETNYKFYISTDPEDFKQTTCYENLKRIFVNLQKYRGYKDFVRAKTLPNCDFFVPNPGFIVEFDESQHFTIPRKIALQSYPTNFKLGFSLRKWISLCDKIKAKDNDPPYRDEQRAWYDTLRDFLPALKGLKPTGRLYSKEMQWCSLDPEDPNDVNKFKKIIENRRNSYWNLYPHSPQ